MKARGPRLLTSWVRRLPDAARLLQAIADAPTDLVRDPLLLAQTVSLKFAIFVLDALTLWLVLRGLGKTRRSGSPSSVFIMASVAATLGPMPLGLSTFEAAGVGIALTWDHDRSRFGGDARFAWPDLLAADAARPYLARREIDPA
jgi:glycosyltransferase 2 family protein